MRILLIKEPTFILVAGNHIERKYKKIIFDPIFGCWGIMKKKIGENNIWPPIFLLFLSPKHKKLDITLLSKRQNNPTQKIK